MGIRWTKIGQGLQATYHETRKHGRKPDMYIRGRYTVDSETKTIGFGWQSEFAEGEKARVKKEGSKRAYQSFLDHCIGELSRLKKNAQTGSGPTTIKEERQAARKKEEEQKALELKGRKEAEQLQIKLIPFADFFEQVYWPIATSSKKSESYRKEREHFNKWISPVIGKMPFKEIKKDDIEKIKWRMQGEKKSPRSLEYVLSTVRLVWNAAIEEEIIDRPCPTKKIKFDMPDNSRDRYLTDDESEELLSKLRESSEQVYLISLASLETGARFSEIARLKWGDVDIESETLTFRDTKKAGGTKKRSVPMTQALKSMFQEMDRGSRAELVFKDRTGKQLRKVSNTFPKTVAALGLNDGIDDPRQKICYHSLRHSAASRMIQAGIDIFLVQKLLGHSVIRVTEKYSHLSDDTLRDAVKQMEKTRNKKKSPKVMNLRQCPVSGDRVAPDKAGYPDRPSLETIRSVAGGAGMTLPQKEVEYFPELNLPLLKELIENRTVRRFKGLPLDKITLYRYSGQYQAQLQPTTQYVIVFDLGASWQELTEDQLEKCRDLDADTGWNGTIPDETTLKIWGFDALKAVHKFPVDNHFNVWKLFMCLYPCEHQVPDRPGFYSNRFGDPLSPGFNGESPKGIMVYEPSVILYEGFFPNLRLNILKRYAKSWMEKFSESPITLVRLHKFVPAFECKIENDLKEEYKPPPYKYAIVFEVAAENKTHGLNGKELLKYDLKKITCKRPPESYERLLDATEPGSREPYEKRYNMTFGH